MPAPKQLSNRGPAAAADNRRAIITAARRLFAERGFDVPLSAIARAAAVGQGVFYRHFPNRWELALTVFEDNFAELETIAADGDPATFWRLWQRLVQMTVEGIAFVEMVITARRSLPEYDGPERIRAILAGPLQRAQAAGLVRASLSVEDVLVAQHMVYGVVVGTDPDGDVGAAVDRALVLMDLVPPGR